MDQGPRWIGIGAQRSGTTWFTDLLLQHPEMSLGRSGRKEQHALHRGLTGDVDLEAYRAEFEVAGVAGEWTPFYLRAPWVPQVALRVTQRDVPFLVLLRDPVERFASAMRLEASRRDRRAPEVTDRLLGTDACWAGMYASHLQAWADAVGERRLVVMQYERVRRDPQRWATRVWARLGLEPAVLDDVDRPSETSTDGGWEWPSGLQAELRRLYAPEVKRLCRRWGIRRRFWPNFA